jgi:hypothetical protein
MRLVKLCLVDLMRCSLPLLKGEIVVRVEVDVGEVEEAVLGEGEDEVVGQREETA